MIRANRRTCGCGVTFEVEWWDQKQCDDCEYREDHTCEVCGKDTYVWGRDHNDRTYCEDCYDRI